SSNKDCPWPYPWKESNMPALLTRLLLPAILLLSVLPSCAFQEVARQDCSRQAQFGLPSPAQTDLAHGQDYLIECSQYVLSYNAKLHRPNWVSWSLRSEDIGKSTRGTFEPDPLLPRSFVKITSHTYDGSGFDRGHMCPAQDR